MTDRIDDRLYRRLARVGGIVPRKRSEYTQAMIAAVPKYPVNFTAAIPADLHGHLTKLCKATSMRKYELLIAAIYNYLHPQGLLDDDTLLPYVSYVEKLIERARASNRLDPVDDDGDET